MMRFGDERLNREPGFGFLRRAGIMYRNCRGELTELDSVLSIFMPAGLLDCGRSKDGGARRRTVMAQTIELSDEITEELHGERLDKALALLFPDYSRSLKFDIWDTVGQERYRSLTKIFYKDADIIIFVYDITTEFSFNAIKDYWYNETKETILALVANKIDLYKYEQIKNSTGKEYADKINAIFQNTSALSNTGIDNLFENLGKKFIDPDYDYKNPGKETNKKIKNTNINNERKKGDNNGGNKINLNNAKKDKKKCC